MQDIYRQPILDRKYDLVAYELSFRTGQSAGANAADDVSATAKLSTDRVRAEPRVQR